MTPEAERYLDKSLQCLVNARTSLSVNLTNDAGRGAYLAAFHAAQALIFERTGKISKSHQGVHSQFALLAKSDARIASGWVTFLTQAYNLKAVADYETGPDSVVLPERAAAAIETAGRFVDCISRLLASSDLA